MTSTEEPFAGRMLRVVVLSTREDSTSKSLVRTVAEALALAPATREGRDSQPPVNAPPTRVDHVLSEADAAVALDAPGLERAREASVPFCAAVLPSFDVAWAGDLRQADVVFVAHPLLGDELIRRGLSRSQLEVAGPIAPFGYLPIEDRAADRARMGMAEGTHVVTMPVDGIDEEELRDLLAALERVEHSCTFLFDVGRDVEIGEALRRMTPNFEMSAFMFAEGPSAPRYWGLTDLAIVHPREDEVLRALAVGAGLVLLPTGRSDAIARKTLERAGLARHAPAIHELADSLDQALSPTVLSGLRDAVQSVGIDQSAERIAATVRHRWACDRDEGRLHARGLPLELERLPGR